MVRGLFHLASRGRTPARPLLRVPPAGRPRLEQFGALLGFADMFERAFEIDEYEPGVLFELAGHRLTALRVPHSHGRRLRTAGGRRRPDAGLLG